MVYILISWALVVIGGGTVLLFTDYTTSALLGIPLMIGAVVLHALGFLGVLEKCIPRRKVASVTFSDDEYEDPLFGESDKFFQEMGLMEAPDDSDRVTPVLFDD